MKQTKTSVSVYYNKKALSYGINQHRLINTLSLIKDISNARILDVGCATGYLGKILRKNNNYVVGFDISKKALKVAAKYINESYEIDIENNQLPYLKKFDLIIMSEIIEHLFQPEFALQKILKLLKYNGLILISTPNIMYWGHRLNFLKGNFEYIDQGIMDESHIHFFSYTSLIKLFKKLNIDILKENHLFANRIGRQFTKLFPSLFAYQLIFLLKKSTELY